MTEHTPGPWHVARAIFDDESGEVAYILDGVLQADAPTARLITAAPDLLAACEAVMDTFAALDYTPSIASVVTAAIAKARGQAVAS